MNNPLSWIAMLCLGLACSCTKHDALTDNDPLPAGLSQRLNQEHGYKLDDQGNWVPRTNKRSSFESAGDSPYFRRGMDKKEFSTGEVDTSSWWGNQAIERPSFSEAERSSDLRKGSRYDGEQASLERRLRTPQQIQGNRYSTEAARESGGRQMDKPSDAETDARRRVFQQPDIIDYEQQRAMSLEQSKKLLGR